MDRKTSWKGVSNWYDSIVGEKGHYYHQHVILPNVLRLLDLRSGDSLLDIGCGQGVLSRQLPHGISYVGIDAAEPLLAAARRYPSREMRTFIHGDVTRPWPLSKHNPFSHAACILALQNIEQPEAVFEELAKAAAQGARAIFVLNHPYFRIPRQSRWGFDEASKTQTREIFSYMSPQKIPIVTHPGKGGSQTWSFHRPLSDYVAMGHRHGFVIEMIEEWCSPKESTGSAARYENRARGEFPLFMALLYRKAAIDVFSKQPLSQSTE